MQEETKKRVLGGIIVGVAAVAMITPPWNIFWWGAGATYYYLLGGKEHDEGERGQFYVVTLAPVALPAILFVMAKEEVERKLRSKGG